MPNTYIIVTCSFKSFLISSLNAETSAKNFTSYEKEGGFQSGGNDGTMSSSKMARNFWRDGGLVDEALQIALLVCVVHSGLDLLSV